MRKIKAIEIIARKSFNLPNKGNKKWNVAFDDVVALELIIEICEYSPVIFRGKK